MRADSEQAWLCFQNPRNFHQPFAVLRFVPPFIEVWYEPGRPFHSKDVDDFKTGLCNFAAQFTRMMEKRVHEIFRPAGGIAMLAIFEIPVHDSRKIRIL